MNRRTFVVASVSVTAGAVVAIAQPAQRTYRVGYVSPAPPPPGPSPAWAAFLDGLRHHGFVEGVNLVVQSRYAGAAGAASVPDSLREMLALNVDVVVTVTTGVALEAKEIVTRVPVVMAVSTDPVGGGVIESLARPGGNITGFSLTSPDVTAKRVELLRTIAPQISRLALLLANDHPVYRLHQREAETASAALGLRRPTVEIIGREPAGWNDAFGRLASPTLGLLITDVAVFYRNRRAIAELAARHRLPAVYDLRQYVEAGGLLSYGPDVVDIYRRAGLLVGRILKGAKPAEIPIEQPTKYDLVLNAATARALGLAIPQALRLRASEVIE